MYNNQVLPPRINKYQHFQKLLDWIFENPGLVFSVSFLVIGFLGWNLKWSRLEIDIYDVYDSSFSSSVDLFELKDSYGDNSQMLLDFEFKKPATAGELCILLNWANKLSQYSEINSVTSLWSLREPKVRDDKLWYPRKLEDPCRLNPLMPYQVPEKFRRSFFSHLVSSRDRNHIVFDISFSGNESNSSNVQYVINESQKFVKTHLKDVEAHFLGLAVSRYYFRKIIIKDSLITFGIILMIIGLFRFIYGTWLSGILLALTLFASNVILYGGMALMGIPINILTNNLFLMTSLAGTADFMFVSYHQFNGNYEDSFRKLITPCFFTTLTTVVGFASLNTSDLSLIRQFGNGAAIGAIAEWLMVFTFLPSFLKVIKREKIWVNTSSSSKFQKLRPFLELVLPKWGYSVIILLMLGSVPSFFFLNDQDSPVHNLPLNHEMRQAYEAFKYEFSWEGQVYLYFPDNPRPEQLERILNSILKTGLVYKAENPYQLVATWTNGMPLPRQNLIRREIELSPIWKRYFSAAGQLRIPLYLFNQDLHSLRNLREKVTAACLGLCRLSGQRVVYLEYGEKISRTMIESFVVSIVLVIGILIYLLAKEGMLHFWKAVILSSLMGPLVTMSFIAIFQIPITLVTSIFLAVMVGLAGDNAIQFLLADSGDLNQGIEEKSIVAFLITFVMVAGSSLFLIQTLLPMKILGMLFIFGFLINLTGDYWGLKSLLTNRSYR
jgi:predicted RND superfamily exporter protein